MRGNDPTLNGVSSAALAVKLAVLFSEAVEKRSSLSPAFTRMSPEETSGLYSRGTFWWLLPLFRLGFSDAVKESDLFAFDTALESTSLHIRLQHHWHSRKLKFQIHDNLEV